MTSSHKRIVSFAVRGSLSGVALDLDDADVLIAGGGQRSVLGVQRTDRFAFGHDAEVQRSVAGDGAADPVALPQRGAARLLGALSRGRARQRPGDGAHRQRARVRFQGYRGSARVTTRSGDIDIAGFCGFSLQARAESGDIAASAACAPQQLTLRSTQGSVRVSVPPGRYQVEAESASGRHTRARRSTRRRTRRSRSRP